jgi:hypothetical protein
MQAPVEHALLKETYELVQASYIDGVPPHRHPSAREVTYDPAASCVFVVEWHRFKSMNASTIQEIFRHRHILVLNSPIETVEFDREGLETLGSLSSIRSVQGAFQECHTYMIANLIVLVAELRLERDIKNMNKPGTLETLYQVCKDPDNKRIFNYLDLPMGHMTLDPPPKFR